MVEEGLRVNLASLARTAKTDSREIDSSRSARYRYRPLAPCLLRVHISTTSLLGR